MVSVNRRDIMMNVQGRKKHMTSAQIIIFGFMVVIFMGALLLMLPISTKGPGGAPFLDALFTSTSAVCVTGLIVHDTATYWTEFGQFVIISLIQVGGMGVVTVAVAVAMVSGKKIGLRERSTMQDAISAPKVGGIVRFTGFILKGTFIVELTGAVLMAPQFIKDFGFVKGIWYAVFHSISAFCNAGFDLMGVREPFSSLTHYVGHPVINFAIMMLIVVGGLGFLTWEDIWTNRRCWRKYRMQSKVILTTTALLILIPAVIFYFLEFNGPEWQGWGARIWASLFQSVTPRTAGFKHGGSDSHERAGTASYSDFDAHRRFAGVYGRRYENDYSGSAFAVRLGSILPQGGYAVLRAAYFRGNRALCGGCNDDVYHTLYRRRACYQLSGRPSYLNLYLRNSLCHCYGRIDPWHYAGAGNDITDHTDPFNVLRKSRRTDTGLCGYFRSEASCFKVAPGKDYCGIKEREMTYEINFTYWTGPFRPSCGRKIIRAGSSGYGGR